MERRIAVRGIVIEGGRLLAVKLRKYKGSGLASDHWCAVGGGIDPREPLVAALQREFKEETGVLPIVGGLLFVQQYIHNNTENLEFFFHVTNTEDFKDIDLSKTSHGAMEIAEIGFIVPQESKLLPSFLTEIDFLTYDTNSSTQYFDNITGVHYGTNN